MIWAEDLTKVFDDFTAVNSVHLDVQPGQVLVLLGPNGAGKTTTVRMLTSILIPTRGQAKVAGYDVVTHPDKVRASVGVLIEHHGLYSRLSALEYLEFYARLYGMDASIRLPRINNMLEQFGLAEARNRRCGQFSKGMRQKLALARALLHEPPVLLLDEPTSAMDPESAFMVRNAIRSMRSTHRTIVLCTHNLTEAEDLADQIAIIQRGRIIFNDTSANLKRRLLGAPEYEARLAGIVNGWEPTNIPGVSIVQRTSDVLRFRVEDPQSANPLLLEQMIAHRLPVVSFHEVHRSLEDAYLEAVRQAAAEVPHA